MSGSGFRGRGFGSRGIRPRGPSGIRGGPRFPRPPFNRPPFPRHGSENWHEPPAQPFFPPWQYNGRGHFPKFPVRPPFRHEVPFHHSRGRGSNVHGMPPRMRMPGAPGFYRPELQSENEVYASPSHNEQHESSANPPQISSAPPLGSEEERQQKIIETADKLKQKLSSIKNQEVENFWEDDVDLIPSTSLKEAPNKEVAELHPPDFSLTSHDLKDIGRVDLHRAPMPDDSVVVLEEVCNRNFIEISVLDEEIRNSEGESECNVPNNEVEREVDNVQKNAIDKDIKCVPTIDSTVVQSRENTRLQTHEDDTLNFAEEIPHHNPSVSFNCRSEFHQGNVNTPPRFIPRQMGPRFRMPYPQEMSPMGPGKPVPLRPMHPNSRPPNQLDVPRVMFDPHTPPPAVFNRPPPPSNFHSMDKNLSIDTLPQMQADPMHSGVRFGCRGPPSHLSSPSIIQCNSSNEERMNLPGFDPRKPPPSVITQEEVLQPPPVFDPRLSFQERQRLIPTVASAQLHRPLSMQVPSSTIPPPPPLSGPPPPPAPPGSLLEMVPMTDFDLMPNYSMTNKFDMVQSHFPQLPQQEALEPEQNYIDIEGELFMEPPPEPPILSDYCSPPLPETLPPADAPLPPADAPLPSVHVPLPPVDAPLPPLDAPLPPADTLLPSTEVPVSQTEVPLPISETPSVLFSKKQGSTILCATETSKQQESPRVSKEAISTSTSPPKMDLDKPKQKRLRMKKSKRENTATCSAPTVSMSPNDKVHTVQNQDTSKQYQNTIQEEVPLSEEQSRPKVVFNLNAKIKKISKQEEWQQQADTSTAKHRKLKAQIVALESPTNALRVKSYSQIRKMPSPKSSKSLISSRKRNEGRGRVSESCWKSTVIERFLKMSKNEIRNILNNSGLRKFDIAMKQLVKERRSSLSWEMRNTEDEKIKSYDREQFICQLNEMLDPSATIDITNLPTEFIRHLGEVLQLNSLPQDQTDSVRNTEVKVTPVHTKSKSEPAESTYHKRHGKAISRSLIREENDISMNANEVHEDTTVNNVQINVEQNKETQDSVLNMDLDNIFLAGIAKAKHSTKSATPEKVVTDVDLFFGPSGSGASQSPIVIEPVPETEKFQEEMTFVESRIDKCERWYRKARDDPDMFRNLTKEEWEAKYGKSNNDDEISKPPSRFDSNESSSNKEDISIDSTKSLSIKNVTDRIPRAGHGTTLPVNKYVLNIAKPSSLCQEYQSNKGRSPSDSNSMAVPEFIESVSPIEMSGTTWRERSSETCQTIGKSLRETKSGEDSNERRSTSETSRDKLFTEIGSNKKHREGISSSRKSRRRERKRKTRKEKERRKRKRRIAPRGNSSSYSDSESDSMTLFTELEIKKEIIVKDEPGLEKVESLIENTISRPESTECVNESAQQELTTDITLLANKTIVTNQEPVTNKELITSQELSTTQECTSNKDTSLQMRKQSKPKMLEMSKVPNKILLEFLEKESGSLKTIDDGNDANSQALDAIATTKPLESTSKTSHSAKLDVQKEKHTASTSRSVKDKVLDKSKQEKNDIISVTALTKDVINIPQKSDKRSKDIVPKDVENVRSSSIDEMSVKKSGREAAEKVDTGNGTIRSKSNEERPSTKFQNIKSEGRKEMKLIEEKVKKRSSSLLRDKKSGATKHSKMLTTELKCPKVKIQKEKASSGTADSSEHKKQMIQVQIPTEDNPDLKDPRLSKLKERVQQSQNKSAKDCHSNIFSEKSSVDSTTEEQAKQQTQHSQSTLTSHQNINKTLPDIERNVRAPLTVEACSVDFNAKAAENTSPEVTSPRSLDSPFKGFSEESQLPSEQLARSTLLRSQAEFLNSATVSDESIHEETYKNSALYMKTTFPNEDSSLQSQETTSTEVLPEKSEEPQSKDVTNLLVISASGDISDIQKDENIKVQVSSNSLNEKAESDKLTIDKKTHVLGMCIDTGRRIDENIEQDKGHENIIDTVKSAVEKLQDVNTLKEEHLEKETSEIVEKLEPAKIFDPIITLEQEGIKGLEVAEVDKVEKSSAVMKLSEPAETSNVEKVAVVAKKYELVKIDTTVKPIVVTKGQEVDKSAVAENLQEASKATEPLKVLDVVKSSSMGKSHEKVNSNEAIKIHEVVKLSVAKKTQERHKPHEMVKTYGTEKLRVAEKTQEIPKTHGSKRLETVKISEAVKSPLVRKTRDRYKVREITKIDEVKQSTAVEKTQEFAKLHHIKKELEVVKPSLSPKRHDVTKSPEVVKSSVELKGHDLVETPGVEIKSEVIESFITLKRHDIEKSSEVENLTEVSKSPITLKRHEVVNSPDVQKIPEVERAHEVIKSPVVSKRHDFLNSHEVVKSCEVEEMAAIVKASVLLKRYDPEKIPEIVKPSVLLRRLDVKSPMTKNMQEECKPFVTGKSHEVVNSPIVGKAQEVVKPSTTLKRHEEVKSPAAEKAEEVIKLSTSLKRHKGVKSPIAERRQEMVTRSTTLKRHEEVTPPAIEKEKEVVKPSTTLKRHKEVKSPVAEKIQEVIKPSITLKRHKAVRSPVVEKGQELGQPSTTSRRHEEMKSPVVEKPQEVIKPSTTLKTHEVVKSPIAEKEQELVKPSTTSKRHEEVKSPVVEKIQEIIKPSTTLKSHKVVKSPLVEKGQEVVTPSTTLKRHEVVKSPIAEKEQELVKPCTTSKRHEEVKSPVVEKIQEIIKPSTTLKRHKVVKSPVVEKGQEVVTPSKTLKTHEVVKSPIAEKEQELVKPSTTSKRHEEVKSPVVEKIQEIIKPSTTLKSHKVVKSPLVEKGQEVVTPSTTLKRHEVVKSPIAEKEQELVKPCTTSKRHEEVKSPVVEKIQEIIKPSTTLKRHKVVKSPVVEKGQEVVTPSKTLKRHEVVKSPIAEKEQELVKPSTTSKRHEEVKSPVVEKIQEIIKPSTTLKSHKVVKSPVVEKGQEVVTPSKTLKRHEVVKSPIAEKEQELVKPSTTSKRHEEVNSPVVEKTEEVINPSTTLEIREVVNLPIAEITQEAVKPPEVFESYESPEMEKISGVIKIQQQVKTDEITKTSEVIKIQQQAKTDKITKTQEVSKLHEPSASTSKSINTEVTQTQAEINITKSQDEVNHHHEKSQEISPEPGVSHTNLTKGQYVDSSGLSKCEEKITKRRRVSRWQDNDDIPKVIEPIQYVEKPKIRPRARKERKKHDNDPLHKIKSKPKFKDKKSKAPTTLDKILSRENAMTKESVMSRMIEIDLEIHKLMTEKMTLYQQLNSESSLRDDNEANAKDNHESGSKKRKEVSAEKLTPPRLSSHNRLFLDKGHPSSHQSTYGARNKAIFFDNSQADHESSKKDTLVHVFDNSYDKHQRQTSISISEAKEGHSVDHVNIEIDKSSFPPENKGKRRSRLDKPDVEKTHNKGITSSKDSLNALKNYKKMISKPDKKTDNDIATVRELSVESKSCTSPKYPKDNDDSTNIEENVLEGQHVTGITEDRLQPPVEVDEGSKSSENVSKRSDSKTTERLSIYSDDSTRESSLTLESSEAKKCTTGLALLEETFKREMAISRKLKAAARKHKKEEIETLLKNVNSLTVDEEEIPLNVLFEMKQKQKQHLLEEMGVKSKLEKLPEKSEENSATIWKHAMAVINAVAENRTENVTVKTHELEVPNLGQLVELSTEQTLLEVETTVKSSDTDKIDNTDTFDTMRLISKNIPEPPMSIEIVSPISKTAELHTLNESRHEDLVHTENTPASTKNIEKDLISKDSKKEKNGIQSDILSKNEVKELSAKVAINDTTDSVKNHHDQIIGDENKRLTGGEDERNIHEISKTAEVEEEDEDPTMVLNKKSADNIECPGTLMDSEDNSIKENLTNNLDNTVINAETENEVTDSSTILDVQKDNVIVSPEKESATETKKVDPTIKSKEDLNTSLELESLQEIHEAVKKTMEDLINSVSELGSAETISRENENCSQKKEEGRPVESEKIHFQIEEINRSGSNDFLGFPVSSQTSVAPTEKTVQPSTSTSEEIEATVLKRGRGRPKKRLSTNSSLSGTMSPVPSTSTIPEKRPKNMQSHGKRKSIVLEPRAARKTRKTRSSRSSVELPGVAKEVDPLETSIDAELLSSKGIFVEESKKRKYISQLQLKNCKVRLIDCESTYLRPDCNPSLLHQHGISKINAYGRTISIQCEPSLKIEDNKRSASVTSIQEVITPGYDIVHVESDKEKDSSSFCSWDQNIQEIQESIDVSQDSISQEEITRSRKNYNHGTIENCEGTNDNEHVYLSHLDPTVLRQDEVSSPQPVIDINEDESAANTSSQSDIEILEATKESRSLNQVKDTEGEKMLTTMVLEEEKSPRTEYTVHKGPVLDIKVYGDSFMAASEDGTIYRYSQVSNGILNIYRGHKSAVTCLCIPKVNFSGISRQWLFSGSLDGTLRCYEIDSGQQVRESVDIGSPIQCMDHAWGVIFLGTKSGHVSRFHIKSGVMKGDNIQFSEVSVLALKATSEGPRRVLIVASRNQPITIRDAQNGLFLRTVSGHKNHTVYSLMMDHHMVYCGTSGTLIPVFDFITAEQVTQYNAGVGIVCMRLYKKLLFAGCYDGNIYVFNTKDRKLVCSIPGPGNMLLSMEVVDNKIIAGSKDRGLHIWLMPKAVRALINNKSRNARMKEI